MPNAQCPIPNDARCYNGGNLRNALAPQCPMPNARSLFRETLNFYKKSNLSSPTPKEYDILYNNLINMVDVSIL